MWCVCARALGSRDRLDGASRAAVPPVGTPEEVSDLFEYADIAAWLVASPNWTSLQHLEACPRLARKTRVHCPHMFIVVPIAQGGLTPRDTVHRVRPAYVLVL